MQQWINIGIWFFWILLLGWSVYAWVWMIASDWDSLTHTKWNEMVGYTVPSGALMAFDLGSCPTWWTEYTAARGRTFIWVGQWNTAEWWWTGTNWSLWTTTWAETHTLTEAQMPSHIHDIAGEILFGNGSAGTAYPQTVSWNGLRPSSTTQFTGSGQTHNNMQPSIAVLYCKKD
jgi:hypothetical protein